MVIMEENVVTNPKVRIVFGPGSLNRLGEEVERLKAERILVLTGRTIAQKTPILTQVLGILGKKHVGTFTETTYHMQQRDEPKDRLLEQAKETQADLFLSLGGGTVVHYAMWVVKQLSGDSMEAPRIPIITVPTTLSGAEAMTGGVRVEGGTKFDPSQRPGTVILDPEVTLYTPDELFYSSGFNAINHCIEGTISNSRNPWSEGYYLQALRLLVENMPKSMANPEDMEARGKTLMGGYMSNRMLEFTLVGVAHALCHGLQWVFSSAHGLNNTVMVTHGMKYNAEVAADRIAVTAPALGVLLGQDDRETAFRCIAAVEGLRRRFGLPERLRDVPSVNPEGFYEVAEHTLHHDFIAYNPRQPRDAQELQQVLEDAW